MLKVTINGQPKQIHLLTTAIKGDWPFLRSALHLRTGFTSRRVCHICKSEVPCLARATMIVCLGSVGLGFKGL